MARKDGFYKVRHHNSEKIMMWTTTNSDNTANISGFWQGSDSYRGNDHDMSFINEKRLTEKEVLNLIAKGFDKK